jgi:calcineurin-like phosphoesterase family protein
MTPTPDNTNFIHLSDIHFRKEVSGTVFDVDQDIRIELRNDAKRQLAELGEFGGILITGDIAYAGKAEDYEKALVWLQELCDAVGCSLEDVRIVPGNHDIDRDVIRRSSAIQDRHEKFRRIPPNEIDLELQRYMNDESAKQSIYEPLKEYNTFASIFSCQVSADEPYWEDDVMLNDTSILRLRGLNSTLVSNSFDDDAGNKLILGTRSAAAPNEEGVEYLTLCHHPPQWLRDQDEVEAYLDARVKIQLFGHKHRFRVDEGRRRVKVSAGAMHPDRREPKWQPRYNILSIGISRIEKRMLHVSISPRIWNDVEKIFTAEAGREDAHSYDESFELSDWSPLETTTPSEPAEASAHVESPTAQPVDKREVHQARSMNRNRRLTYRFYTLPYNVRLRVVQGLGLIKDEDRDVPDAKLFDRYFKRAEDQKQLEELWNEIEKAHGDKRFSQNLFAGE